MPFGFDPSDPVGFDSPTFNELLLDLQAKYQAESGILVDLNLKSPDLAFLRTMALALKDSYDDQAGTYASGFWATSAGVALRNLLFPLIGEPLPATASTVFLPVTGTALFVIPIGSAVRLDSDGALGLNWTTLAPITLDGGGNGSGTFTYAQVGAKVAVASSTWSITTPLLDWVSAGPNAADAVTGRIAETEADYRLRATLSALGRRLFGAVSAVPGVTAVTIFENPTDIPDAFFGATHWIEVLVQGGDDGEIAAAIQSARCLSVQTLGTTTVSTPAPGFAGGAVDISFSRPTLIPVIVALTIIKGEGYSSDTSAAAVLSREQAIKDQIVTWGAGRPVGLDVTSFQVATQASLTPGVPGIGDVDPQTVNGGSSVVAGPRDLLVFTDGNITLTGV